MLLATQGELDEVPLYVVVKEVLNKEACVEAVEINYLTFYAFNGPYTIGVPPFAFEAGAHDGDWEHFTVRYSQIISWPRPNRFHTQNPFVLAEAKGKLVSFMSFT